MDKQTEWGTPHWTDPSGYDECKSWNINRWQWEFIRRRKDVREWFDANAEAEYSSRLGYYKSRVEAHPEIEIPDLRSPNEAGFVVNAGPLKLGIGAIPNPRIGDQPYFAIAFINSASGIRNPIHGTTEKRHLEDGHEQFSFFVPERHISLQFDLELPIAPQVKAAKKYLLEFQEHEIGRKVQYRNHIAKWPTYLRVLDARDARATWSQVASILPNSFGQTSEQTARNVHRQAEEVSYNFHF